MINTETESLLLFLRAAKTPPLNVHVSTLHRWRLRGIRGVKLETVLIGGRRYTSKEALSRFFDATTSASNGESKSVRDQSEQVRENLDIEQKLDQAGI